ETHQFLDPGVNQQVIADSYLHRIHSLVDQQYGKKARVQNNIPMVRDISISSVLIQQSRMIQCEPVGIVPDYFPQNTVTKRFLKIKLSLASTHFLCQKFKRHIRYSPDSSLPESRVGNQLLKYLRNFLVIIRTNFIKLCHI